MRLGGAIFGIVAGPDEWIAALRSCGYSAAFCPLMPEADDDTARAFRDAAANADIVIAEVGAWSNPISPDDAIRREALDRSKRALAHADRMGARCCVNISGSRGEKWDGPHPDNFSADTLDLVVESVREIIDSVRPRRTYYTLETMPWMFPDSVESYAQLIEAIDRERFAVHLDPVNLINCPRRYYDNASLLREVFAVLGPHIRSCHAKDTLLGETLTTHLQEVRPGTGVLDYATYLRELDKLPPDTPLMIEHLASAEEYALAAEHIRAVARQVGVTIR